MKSELILNEELKKSIRDIFIKNKYPLKSIDFIKIYFESEEAVQKKSNGNWHLHLQ